MSSMSVKSSAGRFYFTSVSHSNTSLRTISHQFFISRTATETVRPRPHKLRPRSVVRRLARCFTIAYTRTNAFLLHQTHIVAFTPTPTNTHHLPQSLERRERYDSSLSGTLVRTYMMEVARCCTNRTERSLHKGHPRMPNMRPDTHR